MFGFNPNSAASSDSGVFGLPFAEENSSLVYLPVPWEATASYGGGTSNGPQAILRASRQVDLFDSDVLRPYEAGLYWTRESPEVRRWNQLAKERVKLVMEADVNTKGDCDPQSARGEVNELGRQLNQYVYQETARLIGAKKLVGIIGGDHSVAFGALEAISEKYSSFGILHFDAHADTRIAYEGFTWSHASIMYNVLEKIPQVKKLVQIAIRDYCEQEWDYCRSQGTRVTIFPDKDLASKKFDGIPWKKTTEDIVSELPEEVWVSFDIDGLDPRFCPHTGTPVPGGLDFQEANYLLSAVARSGRKIIGFDLCEVAPGKDNEWDANVGARLLYKLSAWMLASQHKAEIR